MSDGTNKSNLIFSNESIDLYLSHYYGDLMKQPPYIKNCIQIEPINKV